jgi:hypothetical protein
MTRHRSSCRPRSWADPELPAGRGNSGCECFTSASAPRRKRAMASTPSDNDSPPFLSATEVSMSNQPGEQVTPLGRTETRLRAPSEDGRTRSYDSRGRVTRADYATGINRPHNSPSTQRRLSGSVQGTAAIRPGSADGERSAKPDVHPSRLRPFRNDRFRAPRRGGPGVFDRLSWGGKIRSRSAQADVDP